MSADLAQDAVIPHLLSAAMASKGDIDAGGDPRFVKSKDLGNMADGRRRLVGGAHAVDRLGRKFSEVVLEMTAGHPGSIIGHHSDPKKVGFSDTGPSTVPFSHSTSCQDSAIFPTNFTLFSPYFPSKLTLESIQDSKAKSRLLPAAETDTENPKSSFSANTSARDCARDGHLRDCPAAKAREGAAASQRHCAGLRTPPNTGLPQQLRASRGSG